FTKRLFLIRFQSDEKYLHAGKVLVNLERIPDERLVLLKIGERVVGYVQLGELVNKEGTQDSRHHQDRSRKAAFGEAEHPDKDSRKAGNLFKAILLNDLMKLGP
ncbi:hypothetical protein ACFL0O_11950, partial [Thermodesulfobacteriota bacterium]